MRIKSIQIAGFKSFVDRTVLRFGPGITAIVGPNGSGKSNVVDAIRWAMGEQSPRRLRGRTMEDMIFAGSEARAPVGLAEVTLVFDNHDGRAPAQYASCSEIEITRRLHRSGESEYRINRTPCRLRDVLDFFRDTGIGVRGYTIVEQGHIAELVSAKPEERRALIEQAAGIGKYRARRQEAERKLAATEQNLARVSDVLGELRRQIASLERQARKAARYRALEAQLRWLDLSLARDERRGLEARRSELERDRERRASEHAAAEAALAARESELSRLRLEAVEHERRVAEANEALLALRSAIKQLEGQIALGRRERDAVERTREVRLGERERLRERLATARSEERLAREEAARVEAGLAALGAELAEAEHEVEASRARARALEAERERLRERRLERAAELARSEDRLRALAEREAEIQHRLRAVDEAVELRQSGEAEAEAERRTLEEGLRELLAERDRLMFALQDARSQAERSERRAADLERERQRLRERLSACQARVESLREVLERDEHLAAGTRFLRSQEPEVRERQGLRALVREVLEVEPELEAAVEAVLGERADALVVRRAEGALSAREALRLAGAGRALFVIEPRGGEGLRGMVPLGEPLLGRVRLRPGYEEVGRALLGDVYLVDDLSEPLKRYGEGTIPATFVTPNGDVLRRERVLACGAQGERGSLARTRELRELEAEAEALAGELERLDRAWEAAERDRAAATAQLENVRNRFHSAALAVASREGELERARERLKTLGEQLEERGSERAALVREATQIAAEAAGLRERLERLRGECRDIELEEEACCARLGDAQRELETLEQRLAERRLRVAERRNHRERLAEALRRAQESAREATGWIEERTREIAALEARRSELLAGIERAERELEARLQEEEEARRAHEAAHDAYEQARARLRELEASLREKRAALLALRDGVQQLEMAARELELELEHLDARIRERWGVDLTSWDPRAALAGAVQPEGGEGGAEGGPPVPVRSRPPAPPESWLDLEAAERERLREETRRKLEALGAVHLGAIEEHEELAERERFLAAQKEDLEATVASLRDAIQRINRTSRRRLRETFEAVNARFRENFPWLFGGGKASLVWTEAEDVLEAGVEVMAQPPGKRLQSLSLLSGGEKSLAAIALLISLIQVHPTPFVLLDEVDAALDDANVDRFNQLVRRLAAGTQFLLITHNHRTIQMADLLYGVTMERRGVSKVVAVELAEAERRPQAVAGD